MNKNIIFSYGMLAHTLMYAKYSQTEVDKKEKMIFPLGHFMISIAMFLRINEQFREKYLVEMGKLGMAGHTLLFMSVILNAKRDDNNEFPIEEKMFLAGQVAMFISYYNDMHKNTSEFAYYEKCFAFMLLASFYIHTSQFPQNKNIFVPMVAVSILYVSLFLMTLNKK
jgi:hypothetical protein